ncbi:pentatricopeptide repeat-containing protein At1g62914, mitochondrial-like isoform X1 [Dioscorea cayenensis subsp. rotundata]|uniref:Pentatricopeptide repeat-containing protein At1g62914, mitochondrial-like isoform X1 n=1 Tax=Dioscorea cayennensis subsp. rotundata TaxID=55577 RepID=A0AB40C5D3_DIOCR|nr:pentatricopeptide repeat-containing protein At1g62914, mitochondrial-like isoform X1 [Dioscorea cayenensis subsp. rotundata]XP_039134982.1 pentatricopeptide repeat-containing protein At1g62914, mitochondrial-like isoform X1 [Dioscorea cayenensis subsp. rotundata]
MIWLGCRLVSRTFVRKIQSLSPYSSAPSSSLLLEELHFDSHPTIDNSSGKKSGFWVARRLTLSPLVGHVVHTLNWSYLREIGFLGAVGKYGLSHSLESFAMLIRIFLSSGMRRKIPFCLLKSLAQYCRNGNSDLFCLVLELVGLSGGALNLLQVYGTIILSFAESLMFEDACLAYLEAKQIGLELDVPFCNRLLKYLVDNNRVDYAIDLFHEMKHSGPMPNVYTYTIMIDLYVNGKTLDIDAAEGILMEMKEFKVSPNEVTYGTYIHGLCAAGHSELAMEFLKDLLRRGLPYNSYCFNAVIRSLYLEGKQHEAWSMFEKMKECRCTPDVYTYSILIDGLCKNRDFCNALKVQEEMMSKGTMPTVVSYSSILHGLCMQGEMEAAGKLFCDMKDRGYEEDQIALNILIHECCRRGDMETAWDLWEEMIQNNIVPDVYNYTSLIYGYCRNGCLKIARGLFEYMRQIGVMPNVVTCTVIIDELCKRNYVVEAYRFFSIIRSMGIVPNLIMYNVMISGLCKAGELDRPLKILGAILKSGYIPDVIIYSTLIDSFAKKSNLKEALKLYNRMLDEGVKPNVYTYTCLISLLCNNDRLPEASIMFKEMIAKGIEPDKIVFTSLISGYCRHKNMKRGIQLFQDMWQRGLSPDVHTYTCLIDGYCRSHSMGKAIARMKEMHEQLNPNVVTYTAVITGYRRIGNWDKAYQMYESMLQQGIKPDAVASSLGLELASSQGLEFPAELKS